MSLNEVLAVLPRLSFEERELLIRVALELNDPELSSADEELIETRLAEHRADPHSAIELGDLKDRLNSR